MEKTENKKKYKKKKVKLWCHLEQNKRKNVDYLNMCQNSRVMIKNEFLGTHSQHIQGPESNIVHRRK